MPVTEPADEPVPVNRYNPRPLPVRLSTNERKRIRRAADLSGKTMSGMMREAALAEHTRLESPGIRVRGRFQKRRYGLVWGPKNGQFGDSGIEGL